MTALDTRARATALRLLDKYGKAVTLSRVTEGSYNPSTGETSSEVVVIATVDALIEDYKGIDYISGDIQMTDRRVTIPASGNVEPEPNDRLTIDAVVYTIVSVTTVWSGELPALFVMQVRK